MGVTLSPGQSTAYARDDGSSPVWARLSVGWDPAPPRYHAAALLLGGNGELLDQVWSRYPRARSGGVFCATGEGRGGFVVTNGLPEVRESIHVDLRQVDVEVRSIVVAVGCLTNHSEQSFRGVESTYCCLDDPDLPETIAKFVFDKPEGDRGYAAEVLASFSRSLAGWTFTAVGFRCDALTVPAIHAAFLRRQEV